MPRVFLGILAAMSLVGCVSQQKYNELRNEYEHLKQALNDTDADRDRLLAENADLEGRLRQVTENASALQAARDTELARLRAELDEARKQTRGLGGFDVRQEHDGIRLTKSESKGDILFDPGSARITDSFRKDLEVLARELKRNNYKIQIEGHTDSDPVVKTKEQFPLGNPQLGAARALSVLAELKKLGVDEKRLSVASYGANEPVASNGSDDGKKRNRRVEVKLFVPPDERGA